MPDAHRGSFRTWIVLPKGRREAGVFSGRKKICDVSQGGT